MWRTTYMIIACFISLKKVCDHVLLNCIRNEVIQNSRSVYEWCSFNQQVFFYNIFLKWEDTITWFYKGSVLLFLYVDILYYMKYWCHKGIQTIFFLNGSLATTLVCRFPISLQRLEREEKEIIVVFRWIFNRSFNC